MNVCMYVLYMSICTYVSMYLFIYLLIYLCVQAFMYQLIYHAFILLVDFFVLIYDPECAEPRKNLVN